MNTDLNIVVIIDRYLPIFGGAQNNVHELCRRLTRDGYKVNILTRRIYKWMQCNEEMDEVKITRLGYSPVRVISKLLCFLYILIYLINKRNYYDIVLSVPCVETTDLLPAYISSMLTKKPYVIRLTGFPTFYAIPLSTKRTLWSRIMETLLPKNYWLKMMRRASAVVAQSSVLKEALDPYSIEKCEVISNGVDFKRFNVPGELEKNSLRKKYDYPEDKVVIINTGRYDRDKNQITLIKAAEYIEKSVMPGKVYVLIIGATQRNQLTSNEDEIKQYVNNRGLGSFIKFIDDVDGVENYLKAADIFCHPTIDEGMSNALIEAMACGLPIICSDIPQEVCMFPEGEGLFHKPHDHDSLVIHLKELITSKELRKSYGDMLSTYAREKYSNDTLSKMYADLFRNIINDDRSA